MYYTFLCVSKGDGDSFQLCDLKVIKLSMGKYCIVFPLLCFVVLAVIGRCMDSSEPCNN